MRGLVRSRPSHISAMRPSSSGPRSSGHAAAPGVGERAHLQEAELWHGIAGLLAVGRRRGADDKHESRHLAHKGGDDHVEPGARGCGGVEHYGHAPRGHGVGEPQAQRGQAARRQGRHVGAAEHREQPVGVETTGPHARGRRDGDIGAGRAVGHGAKQHGCDARARSAHDIACAGRVGERRLHGQRRQARRGHLAAFEQRAGEETEQGCARPGGASCALLLHVFVGPGAQTGVAGHLGVVHLHVLAGGDELLGEFGVEAVDEQDVAGDEHQASRLHGQVVVAVAHHVAHRLERAEEARHGVVAARQDGIWRLLLAEGLEEAVVDGVLASAAGEQQLEVAEEGLHGEGHVGEVFDLGRHYGLEQQAPQGVEHARRAAEAPVEALEDGENLEQVAVVVGAHAHVHIFPAASVALHGHAGEEVGQHADGGAEALDFLGGENVLVVDVSHWRGRFIMSISHTMPMMAGSSEMPVQLHSESRQVSCMAVMACGMP